MRIALWSAHHLRSFEFVGQRAHAGRQQQAEAQQQLAVQHRVFACRAARSSHAKARGPRTRPRRSHRPSATDPAAAPFHRRRRPVHTTPCAGPRRRRSAGSAGSQMPIDPRSETYIASPGSPRRNTASPLLQLPLLQQRRQHSDFIRHPGGPQQRLLQPQRFASSVRRDGERGQQAVLGKFERAVDIREELRVRRGESCTSMSRMMRVRESVRDKPASSRCLPARRTAEAACSSTRAPLASTSVTRPKSMMMNSDCVGKVLDLLVRLLRSAEEERAIQFDHGDALAFAMQAIGSVRSGRTLRERRRSPCAT